MNKKLGLHGKVTNPNYTIKPKHLKYFYFPQQELKKKKVFQIIYISRSFPNIILILMEVSHTIFFSLRFILFDFSDCLFRIQKMPNFNK